MAHTHTTFLRPSRILSGTTRVSWYQKGKTNLDLLEQETVSGSASAESYANLHFDPDTTTPASHQSVSTGRMPFLPPNLQRQSIEGK